MGKAHTMETMDKKEIETALGQLNGWTLQGGSIVKNFKFKDFREAFSAMCRIAFECEAQNHHPDWGNVYNSLTISLHTHDAGGVTAKDFKLAKSIEKVLEK